MIKILIVPVYEGVYGEGAETDSLSWSYSELLLVNCGYYLKRDTADDSWCEDEEEGRNHTWDERFGRVGIQLQLSGGVSSAEKLELTLACDFLICRSADGNYHHEDGGNGIVGTLTLPADEFPFFPKRDQPMFTLDDIEEESYKLVQMVMEKVMHNLVEGTVCQLVLNDETGAWKMRFVYKDTGKVLIETNSNCME